MGITHGDLYSIEADMDPEWPACGAAAAWEDGMTATEHGRRRLCKIRADEGEWQRVVERAREAGLSVSYLAVQCALKPGPGDGAQG